MQISAELRRQFHLPEEDEAALNRRGLPWETLMDGNNRWLLVHDFPVPSAYNIQKVTAAIRITPSYPDAQLDMVYFYPSLALSNGRTINRLTPLVICGTTYQQWSRHRTGQNPWRVGEDNIESHLMLVEHWLERELKS